VAQAIDLAYRNGVQLFKITSIPKNSHLFSQLSGILVIASPRFLQLAARRKATWGSEAPEPEPAMK
jgi:hypothetical protein